MKTPFLHALAVVLLFSCGENKQSEQVDTEADAPIDRPVEAVAVTSGKYKIKSGVIQFESEGFGMKSTKTLYFDDYGAKERSEVYESDGSLKEVMISDGQSRYTLIPKDKSAYFVDKNGNRGWEMEFTPWEEIQKQSDYQEKYKKADNLSVAGKDCESYVYSEKNRFAGWNGLTLYHQQGTNITIKAVSLDETTVPDASMFTVPSDYTVKQTGF